MSGDTSDSDIPFQRTSDVSVTKRDRYSRQLERSLFAPFRIVWNDARGRVGLLFLSLFVLMGTVGVWLIPAPSSDVSYTLMLPFQTMKYPLGTDSSGRGILALVVHGTPPIIEMVLAGAIFAIMVGALVGIVAGYKGGAADSVLMFITDTMLTLPGLPLVIVVLFIFEPESPALVGIILAINNWTGLARSVRSQVLTIREDNFIESSRLMEISLPTIVVKEITPLLMPYIVINFMQASRNIIFESVGLYFLGILPAASSNWGVIMNSAYNSGGALYSIDAAHWLLVPMLAITLFTLGLILLGQAMDKVFNPRIRARHSDDIASDDGAHE